MNNKPEVLAIIPARGNSKSIPHKNVVLFAGYPLIAYSIQAAKQAQSVTRVITSTDDEKIAEIAHRYGSEVPFLRPNEIAGDDTPDFPVFEHALKWLEEKENYQADVVVQLRPTSPIRPLDMVDRAVEILLNHPSADSVRGVVPSGQNPYKMWKIDKKGTMKPLLNVEGVSEPYNAPRQDLPETFWQTGHIDAIRAATILHKKSMSGQVILPLIVDAAYTVDIDTALDWQRAERCVLEGLLEMVFPGNPRRKLPSQIKLLVMDFDGVLTDDRVWVDETGREMIAANRADGLGLERLSKMTSIKTLVISKEINPVVGARCDKLGIQVIQGVDQKKDALEKILQEENLNQEEVIYVGNDVNDLECFQKVGWAAAPSDANQVIKRHADWVLNNAGGYGAIRELCDLLISHNSRS